jgi:hypothetical protein
VEKVAEHEYKIVFGRGESILDGLDGVINGGQHPTVAYHQKSVVLDRYLKDPAPFARLAPILNDILTLHDIIAEEGSEKYNDYFRQNPGTRVRFL